MLLIKDYSEKLFSEAYDYFWDSYFKNLENKPNPSLSLVARYLVASMVEESYWVKKYFPKSEFWWKPIFFDDIRWSISHKENRLFVWVAKCAIWVDIELIRHRSLELLDIFWLKEYNVLWVKTWDNFYKIWTAKESVIKSFLLWIDDISNLIVVNIEYTEIIIDWIMFQWKIYLTYNSNEIVVYWWIIWQWCYSVLI